MALTALSPIGVGSAFIPLPVPPRQALTQDVFGQVLGTSLSGVPVATAAITSSGNATQSLAALEQALFSDWLTSMQNADTSPLAASLDPLLSDQFAASNALAQLPFGGTTSQSLDLTARLVALFNTVQLLGTAQTENQSGSLFDLLA